MLDKTGIPSQEQVKSRFPEESLLVKPKAVLECYEDIPCNPCSTNCPFNAIEIGEDINRQPRLLVEKCTGCGQCVTVCPGLAIMTAQVSNDRAIFKIPYEFLPFPRIGEIWDAVDRGGNVIGKAVIEKTVLTPKQDKTMLLTVSVDRSLLYDFISVRCPQ
jgi:Fe-S-cluster-containing hydrogenase component 2